MYSRSVVGVFKGLSEPSGYQKLNKEIKKDFVYCDFKAQGYMRYLTNKHFCLHTEPNSNTIHIRHLRSHTDGENLYFGSIFTAMNNRTNSISLTFPYSNLSLSQHKSNWNSSVQHVHIPGQRHTKKLKCNIKFAQLYTAGYGVGNIYKVLILS